MNNLKWRHDHLQLWIKGKEREKKKYLYLSYLSSNSRTALHDVHAQLLSVSVYSLWRRRCRSNCIVSRVIWTLSSIESRYACLTIAPVKCSTQFFTPLDRACSWMSWRRNGWRRWLPGCLLMSFQTCTNAVTTRASKFPHKSMSSQNSSSSRWLGGSSLTALPSACTNARRFSFDFRENCASSCRFTSFGGCGRGGLGPGWFGGVDGRRFVSSFHISQKSKYLKNDVRYERAPNYNSSLF